MPGSAGQQANSGRLGLTLWCIIGLSLLVHVASLVLGKTLLADWRWEHHPVHAAVEMAGAVIALAVAWMLLSLERRGQGSSFNVQIAAALIGMGVLDGLHALVHAGNCFVWLHSTATLAGGGLFVLVWLPRHWSIWHVSRWPVIVSCASLLFGLVSLALPHTLPSMVANGAFSLGAKTLNVGGGLLLLAAAVKLVQTWKASRNTDDLLFCLHCALFGAAAIMFEQSALWDLPWWGWHLLRLMAYLVALWFVILTDQQAIENLITTRRQLRELEATLEAAPTGIVVSDAGGKIVFVNEMLLRLFEWDRDELIGQEIEVLLPPKYREDHVKQRAEFMQRPLDQQRQLSRSLFAVRRSGREFPVEVGLSPLELTVGPCVLSSVIDATERWQAERERQWHMDALAEEVNQRKRTEQQLRRSNEDLQQFAYVASHDLQEPLRAVSGYCDLLGQIYSDKLDDEGREFLQHAVDGAQRMQSLIADLLDYSRVGTRGHGFVEVSGQELFDMAVRNLHAAIEESGATVTTEELPVVVGDRSQLARVFQNLIGNALKFHDDRPLNVHVKGCRTDDEWVFEVHDNGIGIAEEYLERIFVIFQRLHTRRKYAGTGMGLAICKRIVDRHDGWISVKSTPGEGSVFRLGLPVRDAGDSGLEGDSQFATGYESENGESS